MQKKFHYVAKFTENVNLVQVGNGIELEAVGLQVRTLPVAPLWCDLGFVSNSRGNKAAANLRPKSARDLGR